MSLQITAGPTSEPVTIAEVKDRLRLTTSNDDGMIAAQITAAREFAEKVTRRSLAYKSYAYFLDKFPYPPRQPIQIPVPPLIAVTAVKYVDTTLTPQIWSASEYLVASSQTPALLMPVVGLIYPFAEHIPGSVEIDFTAGYGYPGSSNPVIPPGPACPEHLKEGIRQLAVHIYEHPEAVSSEGLKEAPLALMSFFGANKVYVF